MRGKEETLYPVGKASSVLMLQDSVNLSRNVSILPGSTLRYASILRKLDPVQPNLEYILSGSDRYTSSDVQLHNVCDVIFGNIGKPSTVLLALDDIMHIHSIFGKLDKTECLDLLDLFLKHHRRIENFTTSVKYTEKFAFLCHHL